MACHLPNRTIRVSSPGSAGGALQLRTAGTCPFSAWEEAASVVTDRLAEGVVALCLIVGRARGARKALAIMVVRMGTN